MRYAPSITSNRPLDAAQFDWTGLPVPRVAGRTPAALCLGLALLLLLGVCGATLVHIIEYHLGLGGTGDWRRSAAAMCSRYPLSFGLLIALFGTGATLFALLTQVRLLGRRHAAVAWQAARAGLRAATIKRAAPRRPARLVALLAPLLGVQVAVYAAIDHLWPMGAVMSMDGVRMIMPSHGAVPLFPVHLLVALLLAVAVWRLERRITVLRAAIAAVRRLLLLFLTALSVASLPLGPTTPRLSLLASPALLSRPPPACSQLHAC